MEYYVLASGSQGNCAVICSSQAKVIVDCGPTVRYLNEAFDQINIDYNSCDGILITHSHTDHIRQIKMFSGIPVYAPFPIMSIHNEKIVEPYQPFQIKDLTILPVALSHDSGITVGYIFHDGSETLVQITDTGYISQANFELIKGADYYIFESNHDPEMLMKTSRPAFTKRRILSDEGHMSNEYASDILCRCIGKNTREIILAHISQQANDYDLAYYTLKNTLLNKKLYRQDLFIKAIKQFEIYHGGNTGEPHE